MVAGSHERVERDLRRVVAREGKNADSMTATAV
ncbi:MAG: hypothetical protein QOH79_1304, partial [Acidimicrobiaceae bacterium]